VRWRGSDLSRTFSGCSTTSPAPQTVASVTAVGIETGQAHEEGVVVLPATIGAEEAAKSCTAGR